MLNFELTLGAGLEIALMIVGALIALIGLVSLGVSVWLGIKYYTCLSGTVIYHFTDRNRNQ